MPKDNEVDEKVKPVAWIVTNGGESCEPWLEYEHSEVDALPAVCIAEPLYSAATVAELRADRDSWREQAEDRLREWDKLRAEVERLALAWRSERDASQEYARDCLVANKMLVAAERRVGELEKLMAAARRAIGDHHAPNDCYATGPLTGDAFLDLVQCPACAFLDQYANSTKVTP